MKDGKKLIINDRSSVGAMGVRKLVMVDFWTVCDHEGKPVGHGGKVGNEYYDYIKDDFDVVQYVNESMLPHLNNQNKKAFTRSLQKGVGKIQRIVTNMRCLGEVYQKEKNSVIWFYVPDIYLFIFLLLKQKGKRKIAVNVYESYVNHKLKHWIFQKAIRKADVVFVTNKSLQTELADSVLVPDYAYREEFYKKYRTPDKKERVICLGTMNEKKQLVEAVKVFSENGYPLSIIGQFASKQKYEQLCSIKGNNIIIENRYVDFDEYYHLLAESKFCLIPYDADFYKNRTSGVIQECLFCNTVPVSHEEILEFANIKGIGYKKPEELSTVDFYKVDTKMIQESYVSELNRFYGYDMIKKKIGNAFADLKK